MSQSTENAKPAAKKHTGGCHCGAVRFEVDIDATSGGKCNCSICQKTSVIGGIVKPDALVLLAGADSLSVYEWGAKISRRFFCKHCGIHCFGRGHLKEVGGDYASVNYNCLDGFDPLDVKLVYWDGRHDNWQGGPRSTPWPVSTNA